MQEKIVDKKLWITPEIRDQQVKDATQACKTFGCGSESPSTGSVAS